MSATDRWYEVRNNMLLEIHENDGPTFMRHGPERSETVICPVEVARIKYPAQLAEALGENRNGLC